MESKTIEHNNSRQFVAGNSSELINANNKTKAVNMMNKETYLDFKREIAKRTQDKSLTFIDILAYNIIREINWDHGFTPKNKSNSPYLAVTNAKSEAAQTLNHINYASKPDNWLHSILGEDVSVAILTEIKSITTL